ncbi:hypothetical protein PMAYCL1PPCAC_06384, partial [Pristionchus mayeri]
KILQNVAFSWAAIVFGVRLCQMVFGVEHSSFMCEGARRIVPLLTAEFELTNPCKNLSAALGIVVILLGFFSIILTRMNIPIRFISVDFHSIKRTVALTIPTSLMIIAQITIGGPQFHFARSLAEFNNRIVFSSCHLGSIALLLLLLNHFHSLCKFVSGNIFFHKKSRIDLINSKIII